MARRASVISICEGDGGGRARQDSASIWRSRAHAATREIAVRTPIGAWGRRVSGGISGEWNRGGSIRS